MRAAGHKQNKGRCCGACTHAHTHTHTHTHTHHTHTHTHTHPTMQTAQHAFTSPARAAGQCRDGPTPQARVCRSAGPPFA
ncbi:hypothetical protein EON66_09555 [archaeon]|nr:MAG: hypothetical protein EON66_09555 [archaeon]